MRTPRPMPLSGNRLTATCTAVFTVVLACAVIAALKPLPGPIDRIPDKAAFTRSQDSKQYFGASRAGGVVALETAIARS